jgi:hypothetical protein
MQRFCHGHFDEEIKRLLKSDDNGIAFLSQPCAVCGRHVVAENKAGEWVPTTHYQPQGRPLKGRGGKR